MFDHVRVAKFMVGHPGHIDQVGAVAATGQPDIGLARFSRAVDDAADDRDRHGRGDMGKPFLELDHGFDHFELLAGAGRAGDDGDALVAQVERLQDLEPGADFLHRIGGQRHPDGIADPLPQKHAETDRRFDGAGTQSARLGDAEMQRIIANLGQAAIGGDGEKHVRGLDRHLEVQEIVVLENMDVPKRAFHQGLGTGFGIFLQEIALQGPGVDADAHGAPMVPGRGDDLADPVHGTDVAGIDAQAGRPRLGRFDGTAVMEMDIGDDGHCHLADDLRQGPARFLVGAGNADDIDARLFQFADLGDGPLDIGGRGIGHGLDGNQRIAAHGHGADADLPGRMPRNVAKRPNAHGHSSDRGAGAAKRRGHRPFPQ